jgi:hypothetical protein
MSLFIKQFTFVLLFLLGFSFSAESCNGGCPSGGGYMGIVPQFSKNFIGLRYRMRSFSSTDASHGVGNSLSNHLFQTAELWGRFYPSKRIQAFVFLPYQLNSETVDNVTSRIENIGDMSFIFNYNLINTGDSLDLDWKHNLLLGVGAKLPTGKYQQRNAEKQMYPVAFQAGTGAYSAILSAMYTLRFRKMGLNSNFSYYYNGKNELDYSFGNLASGSLSGFYWFKINEVSILPSLGTYLENTQRDIDNGYYVNTTGGTLCYYSLGTDVYINRFAISLNVQKPYLQDVASGIQSNDIRLMSSLAVLF